MASLKVDKADVANASSNIDDSYSVLMHPNIVPPRAAVAAAILYEPSFSTFSFDTIGRGRTLGLEGLAPLYQPVILRNLSHLFEDEELFAAILATLDQLAQKLSLGGSPTSDAENAWVARFRNIDRGGIAPHKDDVEPLWLALESRKQDLVRAKELARQAMDKLNDARACLGASEDERSEKRKRLENIESALRNAKGDPAKEKTLSHQLKLERDRVLGGATRADAESQMQAAEDGYQKAKAAVVRANTEVAGLLRELSERRSFARDRAASSAANDEYSCLLKTYDSDELNRLTDTGIYDRESGHWAFIHVSKLPPEATQFLLVDAALWADKRSRWDGYVYGPWSVITTVIDVLARGFCATTGLHRPYALRRESAGVSIAEMPAVEEAMSEMQSKTLLLEFGLPIPPDDVRLRDIVEYRERNQADLARLRQHCRTLAEQLAAGTNDATIHATRLREAVKAHLENIPPDWRQNRVSLGRLVASGALYGSVGFAVDWALEFGPALTFGALASFVVSEKDAIHELMHRRHVSRTRRQSEYAYCLNLPQSVR